MHSIQVLTAEELVYSISRWVVGFLKRRGILESDEENSYLVPVAPFTVFNLVAGASHLKFRQFLVGSLIGLVPGLAAITFFSSSLWRAVTTPNMENLAIALGIGTGLLLVAWWIKQWLRSG